MLRRNYQLVTPSFEKFAHAGEYFGLKAFVRLESGRKKYRLVKLSEPVVGLRAVSTRGEGSE